MLRRAPAPIHHKITSSPSGSGHILTRLRASETSSGGCERIKLAGGGLRYWPAYWRAADADDIHQTLVRDVVWRQQTIRMFGKPILEPRLSAWYGDPLAVYRYSGATRHPLPWTTTLDAIRAKSVSATNLELNACLANLYRDGQDSMGWHSDDERELGDRPIVVSASFGAPRRFCLRHRTSKERFELTLGHGSLLVMEAGTQTDWKHAVPKTKKEIGSRVNLTFRRIVGSRDERSIDHR